MVCRFLINTDLNERLAERERMVQTQLLARDITVEAVLHSMLIVHRHKYVRNDKQQSLVIKCTYRVENKKFYLIVYIFFIVFDLVCLV